MIIFVLFNWSTAVVSVVTVMGYAIFRYIKIKAVGYDTME